MKINPQIAAFTLLTAMAGHAVTAWGQQDSVTVSSLTVEPATFTALAFDIGIAGDDNRSAQAEVSYRKVGARAWQQGLPMFRLQNETVWFREYAFPVPNAFSGSIFDLDPDTGYQVRVRITDPDGTAGMNEQTVTMRTRALPRPAADGNVYHVYPFGFQGEKQQPAFEGLLAAYYALASHSDHSNAYPPRVKAGDTILVHAGVYKDGRQYYGGRAAGVAAYGTVVDGTYYLTADGTAQRPIVIRGAGDGEVVFDGDGNAVLFDLMGADYNYFEGITVRNTELAFLTGRKNVAGSSGFTLMNSRLENIARGVHGDWGGSRDVTIMDNVFVGRHDPNRLLGWIPDPWNRFEGFPNPVSGPGGSEAAVKVYGQGHVIAFNRVEGFHDGIDHATYGVPGPDPASWPQAIDIHNNDFYNIDDNCVEADGAVRNIRVMRNRCFNAAQPGLSMQPMYGGPAYFIRNVLFNQVVGGLKFTGGGAGVLVAHNTIIGEAARDWGPFGNQHYRNNLIVAQGAVGRGAGAVSPGVFEVDTSTGYSSSDYNGFAPWPATRENFRWTLSEAKDQIGADKPGKGYANLKDYAAATGQDQHSVLIDYSDFVKAFAPDMSDLQRLYDPAAVDLRLRADSKAIDAGVRLPNLNDGFTGKAPDLGAYEAGQELPHYGPRN
ncbi:MAG: hypothetical protein H6978_06845 [Gammaproteobacteria bacterium]|nr:hypothetical protein [Gammaproteobacteria bacterium]